MLNSGSPPSQSDEQPLTGIVSILTLPKFHLAKFVYFRYQGGMYVFNLFDMQSGGISLLFIGFCEAAVIGWGVGKDIIVNLSSFHFPFISFITRQFEDPLKIFPRCSHCLGTQTLGDMIEKMIGKRPNIFFLICWKYLSPLATLVRVESNVINISLLCSSFYSAKSVHE